MSDAANWQTVTRPGESRGMAGSGGNVPDLKQTGTIGTKRALALMLIATVLLLTLSGLAQAWTPAIDKAMDQAAALRALIDQLDEELSAAAEEYDYANQQLEDTQAAIKKTQKLLTQSETDLATVQDRLNQRVVEIYKAGDLTMLAVILDASSFTDLIARYDQLQRLSKQDADLLKQVQDYKIQTADRKAQLETELAQEQVDLQKTTAAKDKVTAQLAKQKKALQGKETQIAQLKKAEAARQAALLAAAKKAAAEAARKAAAERAAREAAAKAAKGKTTTTTDSSGGGGGGTIGYNGDRAAQVVDIALQYVGVPYVWGASSPDGFDCSGLVKYAYGKIGIYLPHSSAMQYGYGVYVPKDQLKPGDLVFFYTPIHHVGIYIGNGKMVNATGDHVQIGTVWKSSYHGARRILN
jgi:cell wall-associated NlpC family hydrolase